MILALAVALGAAFGAVARYLVDRAVAWRYDSVFPAGTWVINWTVRSIEMSLRPRSESARKRVG